MSKFGRFLKRIFGKPAPVIVTSPGSPIPDYGQLIKINIRQLTGFTPSEIATVERAEYLLDTVLNDPLFKNKMANARFTETNGMTNQQVYEKLISGDCNFTPPDNSFDLSLVMYRDNSNVVGYYDGSCTRFKDGLTTANIYINRKFFSTPVSVASNLLHEYAHACGFSHYKSNMQPSVPYTLNRIFEACCAELGIK